MFETFRHLGAGKLITMGLVAAGFVAFFIYLISRLTSPTMALLYAGLDPADSGKIISKLESMSVPFEVSGNQIMVPQEMVGRLRMTIAQDGLPGGGTMGYELFDKSDALGTSNFVLNIHHLRALEGELSRTIRSLAHVRRARVHLVLPRRQLFTRDAPEPSASVVLQMRGGRRLTPGEIGAVQQLVATAVPNLQPTHISIVDGQGTLLAKGRAKSTGEGAEVQLKDSRRTAFESKMARTIEEMLERTVGAGRIRAEVSAEMDFDRISTTTETFDPDGQVVRSTQTVEETANTKDAQVSPAPVTITNSLPASNTEQAQAQAARPAQLPNTTNSNRVEETVNFEISRTTRTHVQVSGEVKKLSVAVLVDGTYVDDGSGNRTYQPRTQEEMAEYKRLVETAIGFDAKRGDKVEVINLRFAKGEEIIEEEPRALFGMGKNDYIRIAELLILGIVSILVILLVVRPLIKRVLDALPSAIAESKNLIQETAAAASASAASLPSSSEGAAPALPVGPPAAESGASAIDMSAIEGRVRDSTMKRIGDIVDKHPDEAVSIIRNWMYQES